MGERFTSFGAFYPYYLSEHRDPRCRAIHVVGTALVFCCLFVALFFDWRFILAAPVIGYGFAWIGHFVFEKNRPATFRHPLYSLMGDFRLFFETIGLARR